MFFDLRTDPIVRSSGRPRVCRRSLRRLLLGLGLLCASLGVSVNGVAAPTAAEVAVARQLFKDAVELEQKERWEEAADKLREAINIKETPGLRFHLAHCEQQMGKLVEAQVDYDRADELIRAGAHAPDVQDLLEEARASINRRVPTVIVELNEAAEVERFSIDDEDMVTTLVGRPVPLNPGAHQIRVEVKGFQPYEESIDLGSGDRETLVVTLKPLSKEELAAREQQQQDEQVDVGVDLRPKKPGWGAREYVLVGEGVLTAGALGFGVFSSIKQSAATGSAETAGVEVDTIRDQLPDPPSNENACSDPVPQLQSACSQLDKALADRDRWGTLLIVGYVGAGVGALTMLATFALWSPDDGSDDVAQSLKLQASPIDDGWWYGVSGRF